MWFSNKINCFVIIYLCLFRENASSTAGDIACEFGRNNVDKNYSSADVNTVCLLKQELWDNFIFGQVNFQKFENHVAELVDDIVKNNNLKPVTSLSELLVGNDVSIKK